MKSLSIFLISLVTLSAHAYQDSAHCNLGSGNYIRVSYNSEGPTFLVDSLIQGKHEKKQGRFFYRATRPKIFSNDGLKGLVSFLRLNPSDVTSASVFLIEGKDLTAVQVVKFYDYSERAIGSGAQLGMAAFICQ